MNIILYGRVPSKKNSVVIFVRNGKLFKMPSNAFREWHRDASRQLTAHRFESLPLIPKELSVTVFAPDKRKADLTNKVESIMDLLVDNGILQDDNWFVVPKITLNFGGVDKSNPRVAISIYESN